MKHATDSLWFETPGLVRFADRRLRRREAVFYAEFDGRRRKRVVMKAIGE